MANDDEGIFDWLAAHSSEDKRLVTRVQNRSWERGWKAIMHCFGMWRNGARKRTRMEASRAGMPPSLLGPEHGVVYEALILGGLLV